MFINRRGDFLSVSLGISLHIKVTLRKIEAISRLYIQESMFIYTVHTLWVQSGCTWCWWYSAISQNNQFNNFTVTLIQNRLVSINIRTQYAPNSINIICNKFPIHFAQPSSLSIIMINALVDLFWLGLIRCNLSIVTRGLPY